MGSEYCAKFNEKDTHSHIEVGIMGHVGTGWDGGVEAINKLKGSHIMEDSNSLSYINCRTVFVVFRPP
jgi:ACT domain-containing protein